MTPEVTHDSMETPAVAAQRLVASLQDLRAGPLVLQEVIALGAAAVPALEDFLRGPSQSLYHSRALAADALAAIGNDESVAALVRALRDCIARHPDPMALEAESVVISRIAEHLGKYRRTEVIDALLEALQTRPYSGCARALAEIGDGRAIPLLVDCLHDDAARSTAMEGLRRFGAAAIARLRAALAVPHYVHGIESPSRIDGRTAAARLLAELGDRASLTRALDDRQRAVRLAAALGLAGCTGSHTRMPEQAMQTLLQGLDDPDWARADTIMQALTPHGPSLAGRLELIMADGRWDDATRRRRRQAAVLAGRLGLSAAAPRLARLSGAGDPALRLAAINALAQLPAASASQLACFLTDPEPVVARRALEALQYRGALGARNLAQWLSYALSGPTPWKRWRQLWRLLAAAGKARRQKSGVVRS